MNIQVITGQGLKLLGLMVILVLGIFLVAKVTHQSLVISESHIYIGRTSEIAPEAQY